ncbi:hypothetical protein H8A99_08685 [Bradyrhizobium sp. Arg68]|nr:hypothetical protein [Bradyrhizobium ivorense]
MTESPAVIEAYLGERRQQRRLERDNPLPRARVTLRAMRHGLTDQGRRR